MSKKRRLAPLGVCSDCGAIGRELIGGRCRNVCYVKHLEAKKRSAEEEQEHAACLARAAALRSTLPNLDAMERMILEATERTDTLMAGGRRMETFKRGDLMLCRYTFPVVPENNPYTQTAEELLRREAT